MEVKKLTRRALSILITGMMCVLAYGQNRVSGTVTDATGEPVIGAAVMVSGTLNGTITDVNGQYELSGVKSDAELEVSSIGYVTQVVPVGGRTNIDVVLDEDSTILDEVVVIGYGMEQKRVKMTNSVSKVDEKTLTTGSYANPAQALAGAVAGVKVSITSGDPGATPSIRVRGGTGLDGSGAPLIIVDGQIRSSLSDINPNDIASMEVMKDAGATALYGARAANGVVYVTTKTGKAGTAQINFNTKVGMNFPVLNYDYADAETYIYWMRKAYAETPWNRNILDGYLPSNNQPIGIGRTEIGSGMIWNIMTKTPENAYLLDKGWQEMIDPVTGTPIIFKDTNVARYNSNIPAVSQDYNLSISGGNERGKYYAGFGYYNADGTPAGTFYKRYSFAFTSSYKITDWLESSTVFNYVRANWQSMPALQGAPGNFFGRLASAPPTLRMEDEDGNKLRGKDGADLNFWYDLDKFYRDNQSDKFSMSETLSLNLAKGLTLKGNANWYYSESWGESYNDAYVTNGATMAENTSRNASASFGRTFDQTYNAVLNYKREFGRHSINAMAGTEFYYSQYKGFSASGSGSEFDGMYGLGYTSTDAGKRSIGSSHTNMAILSYFGRVEYDYADKYLLAATFREDGYSSLLMNRWGAFPGVSAGWIFTKEDFMNKYGSWLSYGKLRASYGINGDASGIGAYTLQGSYNSSKYGGQNGFRIGALPNPSLRWEKTRTAEVGVDLAFLGNRLNFATTFYDRLTSDKYASLSLPQTTGFSSITNNNGKYRNRGVEFELGGTIIDKKDFRWTLAANMTYNKNIVVQLPYNGEIRNQQGATELYTGNGNETDWFGGYQEGYEPGMLIGYMVDYMVRSESDIPANYIALAVGGSSQNVYSDEAAYNRMTAAQRAAAVKLEPGDLVWKDINGDGIIDAKDRVVLGNTRPHWTGGFNTQLSWKGLSLHARFDVGLGFWTYDGERGWEMGCAQGTYNMHMEVKDTWTPENPNAKWPRYTFASQNGTGNWIMTSSLLARRGNYMACRELQLSYTLPKKLLNNFFCKDLTVSVIGQNLGYLTSSLNPIPDYTTYTTGNNAGAAGTYTIPRTVLFNMSITF